MKINTRWRQFSYSIWLISYLLLSVLFIGKLIPFMSSRKVALVIIGSVMAFSFAVLYAVKYIRINFEAADTNQSGLFKKIRNEVYLVAILVITVFPLLTQPYFYYDDWWNFGYTTLKNPLSIVSLGRPIQALIPLVFNFITIRNAYVYKWFFLFGLILYSLILYHWLQAKTKNTTLSFLLAGLLSVFAPAMDLLGYTATSVFSYSMLFSALSVVSFDRALLFYRRWEKGYLWINIIISAFLLYVSLITYQIGPQIVFVFLSIELYFSKNKDKFTHIARLVYLLLFSMTFGIYLLSTKLMDKFFSTGYSTSRSEIITSLPQVIAKMHFYEQVLDQGIKQIVISFTGNSFVAERYHGYIVTYSKLLWGNILYFLVITMVIVAILGYWFRTKNFIGLVSLLLFFPMSYFVFLLLSENGYLTYYAFAQISLLMFYFVIGVIAFINFIRKHIFPLLYDSVKKSKEGVSIGYVLIPLLVISSLVSNFYIRDFYINYNSSVYDYIKNSLQASLDTKQIKQIHIYGSISPLNADVYSRFITETALRDLGRNTSDYQITFSRNRNFLSRIEEADYLAILDDTPESGKQLLNNVYSYDPIYRQYFLKLPLAVGDQKSLQQIFQHAGYLPAPMDPNTLVIDISWTDKAYYNH